VSFFEEGLAQVEAMAGWVDDVIAVIDDDEMPDKQKIAELKELRSQIDDEEKR
jgi:hypothetical protein